MARSGTAETLGIEAEDGGPLALSAAVSGGLPVAALDRLAREMAPGDAGFVHRLVPRATLARRRGGSARLSPQEGAKVARLAAIWTFARDVWGGDEAAREFLFRPHMLLHGRPPVDLVLESEFGGRLVENTLGRLKYGTGV